MSAETLRRAADLMRERAEAATPGPWDATSGMLTVWHAAELDAALARTEEDGDARYIASWHPDVALLVAERLREAAAQYDATVDQHMWMHEHIWFERGNDGQPSDEQQSEWKASAEKAAHDRVWADINIARAYLDERPQGADA